MIDKLKKLKIERSKLDKQIEQLESKIKDFTIKDGDVSISIQESGQYAPMYKVELAIKDDWDESMCMFLTEDHIKDIIGVLSTYVGENYEN